MDVPLKKVCEEWRANPLKNPRTMRTIKQGGPVYKALNRECKTFDNLFSYLKKNEIETCNPAQDCRILFLDFAHAKKIFTEKLSKIAEAQKKRKEFVDIFPWDNEDRSDKIAVIAATNISADTCSSTRKTRICGWLTAYVRKDAVYLAEISTRRQLKKTNDLSFKGVGKCIFDRLVAWSQQHKKKYIYLYPLNKKVAEIYTGWGFTKLSLKGKECEYMFYKLKSLPGPTTLRKICKFHRVQEAIEDSLYVFEKIKETHAQKLKAIREENQALYESIVKEIQAIICMCESDEQCKKEVNKYFSTMA